MQFVTGTYTGDGASSRGITGAGFQPHLVIVKGGVNVALFRTATMVTDAADALPLAAAANIASITSLDADGFTVNAAANVNASGTTYYWLAVRDNGAGDFTYGKYTGNAVDGRTVTGLGFAPACFITKRNAATTVGVMRTTAYPTNESSTLNNVANNTTSIKSNDADGVTLGTNVAVNGNTIVYYWFAFKAVANAFTVGTYTGDGSAARQIAASLRVGFAIVKGNSNTNGELRTAEFAADSSAQLNASAPTTNRIQHFLQDGFQIGTASTVNTAAIAYYWFALAAPSVVPVMSSDLRRRRVA